MVWIITPRILSISETPVVGHRLSERTTCRLGSKIGLPIEGLVAVLDDDIDEGIAVNR